MIDHFSISVRDYAESRAFYLAALAPLGYSMLMEFTAKEVPSLQTPQVGGLGEGGKPDLWIAQGEVPTTPTHLALQAKTRAIVDAFYAAALAAGAKDNGAPGLRPQYHPNYYGAFVIDPNGHNLEACCHTPA
jgi:catechol 2,3-dioxygenase-like lactoylglutathione lyase family enzyme